jgi:uncharacterized protein
MLDWLVLGGAALSGLLGGAHCAAMCGGIATSLSVGGRSSWMHALQPNLGRIVGYTIAGAIVGGLGQGLLVFARVPALGIALRAAVGLVLIIAALRLLDRRGRLKFLAPNGQRFWRWLRPLQQALLPADSGAKRFAVGMLWGWLPCGLSTTLLMAAWLQVDAVQGGLTMAAFGLGTLPVMLPLTWAGARVAQRLQRGGWRTGAGILVFGSGLVTLLAPWLLQVPVLHGVLAALGCHGVPA